MSTPAIGMRIEMPSDAATVRRLHVSRAPDSRSRKWTFTDPDRFAKWARRPGQRDKQLILLFTSGTGFCAEEAINPRPVSRGGTHETAIAWVYSVFLDAANGKAKA